MRLGSYINPLPDLSNINSLKQLKETLGDYRPFSSEISSSYFFENEWRVKYSENEKIKLMFNIEGCNSIVLNFWKILLLVVCSKKKFFLTNMHYEFYCLKKFVVFSLQNNTQSIFDQSNILNYAQYLESKTYTKEHKERQFSVIKHWIKYSYCLPQVMRISLDEEWYKTIRFSDNRSDNQGEFEGFYPLSFYDYERLIVGSLLFLHRYSKEILDIFSSKNNGVEVAQFYKNNKMFQDLSTQYSYPQSLECLLHLLQGASITLLLSLCPMRVKELIDLRSDCLVWGDSHSNLKVNIEKYGDGIRWMPIPNNAVIAIETLKRIGEVLHGNHGSFLLSGVKKFKKSRSMCKNTIRQRIEKFTLFLGIQDIPTPHRFRSTCARAFMFLNPDNGIELFGDLVGHKSIDITRTHYAKLGKQERVTIANAIYEQQKQDLLFKPIATQSTKNEKFSYLLANGQHYAGKMFDMRLNGDESFIADLGLIQKGETKNTQEEIEQIAKFRRII